MKQFNLDEYLKNPLKKVVTRDGRDVRIICTDYYGEKPIIARIEESEYSYSFCEDGRFFTYGEPSDCDLFFAPEKHGGWMNLYKWGKTRYPGKLVYPTKEEAKHTAVLNKDYVDTVRVEWEE